jgi:hypothetical protein
VSALRDRDLELSGVGQKLHVALTVGQSARHAGLELPADFVDHGGSVSRMPKHAAREVTQHSTEPAIVRKLQREQEFVIGHDAGILQ